MKAGIVSVEVGYSCESHDFQAATVLSHSENIGPFLFYCSFNLRNGLISDAVFSKLDFNGSSKKNTCGK